MSIQNNIWAIILAGGVGRRFTASLQKQGSTTVGTAYIPSTCEATKHSTTHTLKQCLQYNGKPLYCASIDTFVALPFIRGVVIVLHPSIIEQESASIHSYLQERGVAYALSVGGATRYESMKEGFSLLPEDCTAVFIHDAVRPFFSAQLAHTLYTAFMEKGVDAIVPAVPLVDTIKEVQHGTVVQTPQRSAYQCVQTPQLFATQALKYAITQQTPPYDTITDDASLLENAGYAVHVILGETMNKKITTKEDLSLLTAPQKKYYKTALGYDVHAFIQGGRPLVLGGIPVPSSLGIKAHSDGDVVLHALIDALFSLVAERDIGYHFPDTNKEFENIASTILLDTTLDILRKKAHVELQHVDITIVVQKPKLVSHIPAIQHHIAYLLSIPEHSVSVKATTEEYLGFTGEQKGLKAYALVSAFVAYHNN